MKNAFLFFVLLLFLVACKEHAKIQDLVNAPDRYDGKEVMACGNVSQSINVFLLKGYILKEDGAQILVLTDNAVPHEGTHNCATGIFSQAFKVPGFELFVLDGMSHKEERKKR